MPEPIGKFTRDMFTSKEAYQAAVTLDKAVHPELYTKNWAITFESVPNTDDVYVFLRQYPSPPIRYRVGYSGLDAAIGVLEANLADESKAVG